VSLRYTSRTTLFGFPVIAISYGSDLANGERFGHAKGVIAVGDVATGLIAAGLVARGFFAAGAVSFGVISAGAIALGALAAGAIAMGGVTTGGVAIGVIASGGIAIGVKSSGMLAMALELSPTNRINTVSPGWVDTDRVRGTPMARMGSPAPTYLFDGGTARVPTQNSKTANWTAANT
jgi:hypothetical protein